MKRIFPVIFVLLAGALWGIISLFLYPLNALGFTSLQIAAGRLTVAAALTFFILLITNPKALRIRLRDVWMFLGTGIVSVALFNVCYFYTVISSEVSVAVCLLYTSPLFILLMSALFFCERMTPIKAVALLFTVAGCLFVTGALNHRAVLSALSLFTGIAAGFFYALYTVFGRVALRHYSSLTVTFYTFFFGLLGTLPFANAPALCSAVIESPRSLLYFLGIGILSTVLPYFLYTKGLEGMEAGKAAILVADEPLIAALVGFLVWREEATPTKLLGIALILASIVLLNIGTNKETASP